MTYYSRLLLSAAVFLGCSPAVRAVTRKKGGASTWKQGRECGISTVWALLPEGRRRQARSLPGQILVSKAARQGRHGGTLPA
ncbi:MAG: hypothetical protein ACLT8E_02510 [Akkermansia sp.]